MKTSTNSGRLNKVSISKEVSAKGSDSGTFAWKAAVASMAAQHTDVTMMIIIIIIIIIQILLTRYG